MEKKIKSAEIKKLLKSGNIIIGTDSAIKNLKLGKIEKVLLSSNCPAKVHKDISHYAGISKTDVYKLEYPNEELGIMCKKPFSISVLAVVKGVK